MVEGAAYGSAKLGDDFHPGPQPLLAFYTFDTVDSWFQALPKTILTKKSGDTRVSVRSHTLCTTLRATCAEPIVQRALECDGRAESDASAARCWSECRNSQRGISR